MLVKHHSKSFCGETRTIWAGSQDFGIYIIAHQYEQNPPLNAQCMLMYPMWIEVLFLVRALLFFHKLCAQEMKALTRLCIYTGCMTFSDF